MASGALSRRYARALLSLGSDDGIVDKLGDDLGRFDAVLDRAGDGSAATLRTALENPGLTTGERRIVLDKVLEKVALHTYVANFLRLVVDKNRFAAFSDILREYRAMADDLAGRVRAVVTTARKVDAPLAGDILGALEHATGKHVLVTYEVDPAILGGMVARVGDTVYDASVLGRLDELRLALGSRALGVTAEA